MSRATSDLVDRLLRLAEAEDRPPQPESAAGSAASRAAWSRRDAYQQITCPSVPALLQRPVRPSEEMAAPSCSQRRACAVRVQR